MAPVRSIAVYLPQFHPIPENDAWWGKGFTEWTNVTKAQPRFEGHYQPHLPADLGFYDLRLEEARLAQEALAKEYGLYGFCYYHYWFNGKRLLDQPLEKKLKNPKEDFPFMLCWANENWTRRWDGQDQEILMQQNYNEEDDRNHFQELLKYFRDKRYITVNEKPVFAIYRVNLFPNIKKTVAIWREEALKNGIKGIYLINVESLENHIHPSEIGFDAAAEFQPDFSQLPSRYFGGFKDRLLNKLKLRASPFVKDAVIDYGKFVQRQLKKSKASYKRFPGITPMWDNSSRRKQNAIIFKNATPEQYGHWLRELLRSYVPYSPEENFLFINAWNEWAEGNHLEPCQKWGRQYLETTRHAIEKHMLINN